MMRDIFRMAVVGSDLVQKDKPALVTVTCTITGNHAGRFGSPWRVEARADDSGQLKGDKHAQRVRNQGDHGRAHRDPQG